MIKKTCCPPLTHVAIVDAIHNSFVIEVWHKMWYPSNFCQVWNHVLDLKSPTPQADCISQSTRSSEARKEAWVRKQLLRKTAVEVYKVKSWSAKFCMPLLRFLLPVQSRSEGWRLAWPKRMLDNDWPERILPHVKVEQTCTVVGFVRCEM